MKNLRKVFYAALAGVLAACSHNSRQAAPAIAPDADIESRVKAIVASMSLDDKVGQMCEVVVDLVCADSTVNGLPVSDSAKLDTIFNIYRVGSILNTAQGHAQPREVWYSLISDIQDASMKYIGIPDVYGVDQNHGTTYTTGGTLFPQEINMAATFNRDLVRQGAAICAYETRAASIPWVYNPVMDLGRNPVWSRMWESFGEDPYINGAMAVEMVKGYQGDDPNHIGVNNVAACL